MVRERQFANFHLRYFKKPMNHNVKDWDEAEADIAKVHWQSLKAGVLLREHIRCKLFWELLVDLEVLLVPVLQQVMLR